MARFTFMLYFLLGILGISFTQSYPALDKSPMDMSMWKPSREQPPIARIIYSRPSALGRKIWGKLIPFNKVWRAGANESTEITFYRDVEFGGTSINAGSYTLYIIPTSDSWEIILNKNLHTWGHYQYDKSGNLAILKVPTEKTSSFIESFSIVWDKSNELSSNLVIAWGNNKALIEVK